jgi:hypothetical protein
MLLEEQVKTRDYIVYTAVKQAVPVHGIRISARNGNL